MEEVWKDIEGYEGLYQVSNLGNVKSLVDSNGVAREKILKPIIASNWYLKVDLCKNKTKKRFLVHRLVAKAFIENTNNYPCVNHKDESRINNVVENLEWCTYKYNSNYGNRNERASKSISKANTNNPKLSKSVGAYKDGKLVMTFPSTREARRNGYNHGSVAACCRNCYLREGNNIYKGYIWKYI